MSKKSVVSSVVAAKDSRNLAKAKTLAMAVHKCKGGHTFAVQAQLSKPFCVTCGGDTERTTGIAQDLTKVSSKTLVDLVCVTCGIHNIMSSTTASAGCGKMNCVHCGTAMAYSLEDEDGESSESDIDDIAGDDLDDDSVNVTSGDDEDEDSADEDFDADADDEDGDDIEADFPGAEDEDEVDASDTSTGPETSDDEMPDSYADDEDDDTDGVLSQEGDDEDWSDTDENYLGGDDPDDESDEAACEEVSLLKLAPKKGKVRFTRAGNRIHAYVHNLCVASLAPRKSTAKVFDSEQFVQSIRVMCANEGVEKTLASYKFRAVKVKVNARALSRAEIARAVAGERTRIESGFKDSLKTFEQCIAIAASGMNRDVFKKAGNPLKAEFVDVLSSLNIRNPARVVQSVFSAAADAYHSALINEAMKLMRKPVEVRNQLAASLCDLEPEVPEEDEDLYGEESDITDDVANGGHMFGGQDSSEDDIDIDEESDDSEEARFEERSSVTQRLSRPVQKSRQSATASTRTDKAPLFPKRF